MDVGSFLVVESGHIRFYVRPRVASGGVQRLRDLGDVQRLSVTLAPRNRDRVRRLWVGRKRLPDASARRGRERFWAYVDRIGRADEIVDDLGPRAYETKTRGLRFQAGAIEVAFGTYAVALHRDHAHLMYELDEEGALASSHLLRELRIGARASYVAAVLTTREDARRFMVLDPALLDEEGTEIVLIGAGAPEGASDAHSTSP